MSLPRYKEYKDSGVDWLGAVPKHWTIAPIKVFGRLKGGAGFPHDEQGLQSEEFSFFKVNSLAAADAEGLLQNGEHTISRDTADRLGAFIFPAQTIVFAKVGAALMLGRIREIAKPSCIDNNMMGLMVSKENNVKFVRYAMNLVRFDLIANPGAVPSLNEGQIGNFVLGMPPLDEQAAIATFLDRETAKTDALIAAQEKLISLLTEQRQANISHAVTKGLNPNVAMKNSGVAWLGKVPAQWNVTRLKFVASVQTGIAKGKDTTGKETITVPYLRVANVQDGFLALRDVATIDIEAEQLGRYRLIPGDVLMNEGGDFDKLGRGAIWHGQITDCIHQNHVFAVRPHGISAEWLNRIISSQYAQFYFMGRSKQSTNLASISATNIMELPVVLPPESEQHAILAFIDSEITKLDSLRDEAQRAINLLQERRSALIAAAVTGQIDVRGTISQTEAEIPEPIAA
jgi:type I restriction enzyme S subunit